MIRIAAVALALTMAAPVVTIPVPADAQVMTGRNAARQPPRPRPLSDREYDRLTQAENEIQEADDRMDEIRATSEQAGGMTPEHHAEMQALERKREQANRVVERLARRR